MSFTNIDKQTARFTEAYNDHYALVYSSILTRVSSDDIADELCQEVFVRFYEAFDIIENHRKWLLGTLKNVVFEYYRKKEKESKLKNIDDIFDDVNLTYVNGFRDTRVIIREALEHTENYKDEKDRLIFDLIAVNHYTYEEAGKYVGMAKHRVRYRYKIISGRIIKYLQSKGIRSLEDLL